MAREFVRYRDNFGFLLYIVTYLTWVRRKMHSEIWSDNLKRRDHSEDIGIDGRILLEWILGK
jgi:hypothetical protein